MGKLVAEESVRVRAGRAYFDEHPEVTGAELFDHVVEQARAEGYDWGSPIAGHLVGQFSHKKLVGDGAQWYLKPGSGRPMRRLDGSGLPCHWILEVHLVHPVRGFGGFYEELLDLP